MFILFVIYFICLLLIWWSYAGYIYYLFIYCLLRRGSDDRKQTSKVKTYPFISVIIPIFEEKKLITKKIQNLKTLIYPGKIEFILVDGGSQDGSLGIIKKLIRNLVNFKLLISPKGKIKQINKALHQAKGKIIVFTDVDSLLPPHALKSLAAWFVKDDTVGVVGAYVMPKNPFPVEKEYWQEQNQLRLIESRIYSSSIVVAPCYAFRKSLINQFPDDCVADDIYISFYAQSLNYLVKYDSNIIVYETRTPQELLEFFTHKFRKANAYITELLRFAYTLNKLNIRSKVVFISRFLQVIILPWILLLFTAISVNLFIINLSYRLAVLFIFVFLLISIFLAAVLFNQKLFGLSSPGGKIKLLNLKIFLYSNFILFFAIFTHFFYNQDSSYEKLNSTY